MIEIQSTQIAVGLSARIPVWMWSVQYARIPRGKLVIGYQAGMADSKKSRTMPGWASFSMVFALIASLKCGDRRFI